VKDAKLSIFEKLRTRPGEPSAKALRQRAVIQMLAERSNPQDRTRTGLAKSLAAATGSKWQTVYPAVFGDMEKIMVPLGIIQEEGRLPLRRGPRMMQERGSPYYSLTQEGLVVALAIRDVQGREDIIGHIEEMGPHDSTLRALAKSSPGLVQYIMERYVEAWCRGGSSLLPLDLGRIRNDGPLSMCRNLLEEYGRMDGEAREGVAALLSDVSGS
jgi:hypothetical protein